MADGRGSVKLSSILLTVSLATVPLMLGASSCWQVDRDHDGWTTSQGDCDDYDAAVNPAAVEACDGLDNNCDGAIDEGVLGTFYLDADADGFGDASLAVMACEAPDGFVADASDCNDVDPATNPAGLEVCDGLDNNCDALVDEGLLITSYADADGDGYGDVNMPAEACEVPAGYVADATDCNDADTAIFPSAEEVCDAIDNNCDGAVDEGMDADGDGTANCFDAEDCDGVDNEGDGLVDEDGVCETCSDGVPAKCLTLWQAHARGEIVLSSTQTGDIVVVTNKSAYPLCLDSQVLYTSDITQSMFFDPAVTASGVVGPGQSFKLYYGSWTTANNYYYPYKGLPAWWCVEAVQLGAPGGTFDYFGEQVPPPLANFINQSWDVDNDGREDHIDWAGSYGVQANYNIWNFQAAHAVLTVGKKGYAGGNMMKVLLTARNVGYKDGKGVITDTTPYGYRFVESSVTPATVINNLDGTQTMTFEVGLGGTYGTLTVDTETITYVVEKIRPTDAPYVELAAAAIDYFTGETPERSYSVPAAVYGIDGDGDGTSVCKATTDIAP